MNATRTPRPPKRDIEYGRRLLEEFAEELITASNVLKSLAWRVERLSKEFEVEI